MPKKKKKTGTAGFVAAHKRAIVLWVVVLGIAGVGSYLQVITRAVLREESLDGRVVITQDGNLNHPYDRSPTREGTVYVSNGGKSANNPEFQILVFYTYNTRVIPGPVSVTCQWQHGCFRSGWNGSRHQFTHPARIITCHNIPANFRADQAAVVTFKAPAIHTYSGTSEGTDNIYFGYAEGSCQSNPNAVGAEIFVSGIDGCDASHLCGPTGGPAPTYTGFTTPGNGNGGTGTGNGNGGTGTGTNGKGTGGGGSSGAIAKKQAKEPNSIPSASNQGTSTKQPTIEPSPFYDGKEYKPGSAIDTLGLGISTVGGKQIANFWFWLVALIVIAGSGAGAYLLWWRPKHRKPTQTKRLPKKS